MTARASHESCKRYRAASDRFSLPTHAIRQILEVVTVRKAALLGLVFSRVNLAQLNRLSINPMNGDIEAMPWEQYYLLTGRAPFQAGNITDTLRQWADREPYRYMFPTKRNLRRF